jgi:tripartite ATP-independent transporter DctP family solute receptor
MRKHWSQKAVALVAFSALVCAAYGLFGTLAPAQGASRVDFELKLADASPNDPKAALVRWSNYFAERISANSNGRIAIKYYPTNQLGTNAQLLSGAQQGSIDFVNLSSGTMVAIEPLWRLFAIPYLVGDQKQLFQLFKSKVANEVLHSLESKGLIGLGFDTTGPFAIMNKVRPVKRPEDMKGLKLRIAPDPTTASALNALGAQAVNMDLPQVYSGIQQGVLDGLVSSPLALVTGKYTEVAKYVSLLGPQWVVEGFLMSQKTMDRLPPDLQAAVKKSAKEVNAFAQRDTVGIIAESLQLLQQAGAQVTTDADGPVAPFRAKMGPVYKTLEQELGTGRIARARAAVNFDIVGVLSTSAPFKTLNSLIKRAGLTAQLKSDSEKTFFAPTDAAFKKLPRATMNKLLKNKAYLRTVLRDHLLARAISGGKLGDLNGYGAKSVGGARITIHVRGGKVTVNGARVAGTSSTASTLAANNGFVHVVDKVLLP